MKLISFSLNFTRAEKKILAINFDLIAKEEKFDGFYGVCTNKFLKI